MKRQLVLGSSSQPRQILLRRLKIPFTVAIPDIDETPKPSEAPVDLVKRLAEAKARKIAHTFTNAVIIGADQVGVLNDEILGKPLTLDKAFLQLKQMSGHNIEFYIGLCVFDAKTQDVQVTVENFSVTFRELTDEMIQNYLKKENVLQCAGSFKAEGLGVALVQEFHDTDFSALIGLPLIRLVNMLEKLGMGPLQNE